MIKQWHIVERFDSKGHPISNPYPKVAKLFKFQPYIDGYGNKLADAIILTDTGKILEVTLFKEQ